MGRIGADIGYLVATLAGDSEQARINLRANQVRDRFRRALEVVYRDNAPLFLAHTNNVYILEKDGVRTLIVYVDESIYAAELNAQRELIKLHLLEQFGEDVEAFEIYVSRGKYRKNHPFVPDEDALVPQASPCIPLDDAEKEQVAATVSVVEDNRVRESLQKAMTASLERNKGENRTQS